MGMERRTKACGRESDDETETEEELCVAGSAAVATGCMCMWLLLSFGSSFPCSLVVFPVSLRLLASALSRRK